MSFTTPEGTLFIKCQQFPLLPGVITSGLTITEQPAANAVNFLDARITGKFHGTKAATTPTG